METECQAIHTFFVSVVIFLPAVVAKVAVEPAVSRCVLPVTHSKMPPVASKKNKPTLIKEVIIVKQMYVVILPLIVIIIRRYLTCSCSSTYMLLNDWNISSTSAACIATKMIISVLVHDRVVWCVFVCFYFVLFWR